MKLILHYSLLVSGTLFLLSSFWSVFELFQIGTFDLWHFVLLIPHLVVAMLCLLAANQIKPVLFIGGKINRIIFIVLGGLLTILLCFDVYFTWVQGETGFLITSLPPPRGAFLTTLSMPRYLGAVFWMSTLTIACFFAAHTIKPFGDDK